MYKAEESTLLLYMLYTILFTLYFFFFFFVCFVLFSFCVGIVCFVIEMGEGTCND